MEQNSTPRKSISKKEKKLCLCMIVKNEAHIIERCLDSCKNIIDFVSICDTGSDDQTPNIIEDWCRENRIPGTVHHEPFKNFGYNRSLAVSLAQETYPQSDYLLLLDADMILEVSPDFEKSSLIHDHYLTMQYDGQLKYWLIRLLKTSLPWRSVGVTHEYWDLDHSKLKEGKYSASWGKLETLVVNDQRDGGSRSDKFERDKSLLLDGINSQDTPTDLKARYMFYLGQTYFCLEQYEESIEWYKKRVEAGGWQEEVYFSLFQIGRCYESLAEKIPRILDQLVNDRQEDNNALDKDVRMSLYNQEERYFALATYYYQMAWEYRPVRAEPLYHLARMYRLKSKNHIALMYALQGKEIGYPKDDILFVDYTIHEYLLDYEISISAFYVIGMFHKGLSSQQFLESKIDQLPSNIAASVINNGKFYQK